MTPFTLLRPHVLGFKNRLMQRGRSRQLLRVSLGVIFVVSMVTLIYAVHISFLENLQRHATFHSGLAVNLLRFFLLGFFLLLLLSGTIVSLSTLYFAEDVGLILASPISVFQFFTAKLLEIAISSSWIFFLFAIPAGFAHYRALHLPPQFLFTAAVIIIPFTIIPAALGILFVTIFVNIIPPHRMRDLLVLSSFFLSCGLLLVGKDSPEYFGTSEGDTQALVKFLNHFQDPQPWWSPARWAADLLVSYIQPGATPRLLLFWLLATTMCGIVALSYLSIDLLFRRGLALAGKGDKQPRIKGTRIGSALARIILPSSQFRAMFLKEIKMFIRDTTQALQLLMLLLLTFMYLYNFRALRTTGQFTAEGLVWWQVLLALANTSFGACVLAAVSTRFVFPCISLEGRAYYLLRATPLSLNQYLWFKFLTWFFPMVILSIVLLSSGTMAIQGTIETIGTTALISVILCIGVVGLAVGTGAVYARFDWESAAQVTASFGSLVYMFLSLLLILVSMIPATFLYILSCNPEFASQMRTIDYAFSYGGSLVLLVSLNVMVARRAIAAGANVLKEGA